jgi:hypothetical protein
MASSTDPRSVALSYRLYRAVLRTYPRRFRQEYRDEVAHLFRDVCRAAYRTHGFRGVAGVWGRAVLDLGRNVPVEHVEQLTTKQTRTSTLVTRCTQCSEEILVDAARCMYCGAPLSDPLAIATVHRPTDLKRSFFEEVVGESIWYSPPPPGM